MALQQKIPAFVPADGLGLGEPKVLKKMARPVSFEFRPGGKLDDLKLLVEKYRWIDINAAAGAGKSTKIPALLASTFDVLVIHVVPSVFLAHELFKYVVSVTDVPTVLVTEVGDEWPEKGVAIASAAVLQAKFLQAGEMKLPRCYVYHDEVHRSDCWTYLLTQQWGTMGVERYITATATAGTSGFRAVESQGVVTSRKYPAEWSTKDWDVMGQQGLPWEVSSITGNTLIFEDRQNRAKQLIAAYNRAGFEVFHLHSRMRMETFDAAMHSLRGHAVTVLIAESSFRDGFTWPLETIIDSGKVAAIGVVEGTVSWTLRDVYAFEAYQGAARGGRVRGQSVVAWTPDITPLPVRVALEEVEMDAVALVCRMLGALVPVEADSSVMAAGHVPRDLCKALQGQQPLAALAETQLVPLTSAGYRRAPSPVLRPNAAFDEPGSDYYHRGMSADSANARDFGRTASHVDSAPSTVSSGSNISSAAASGSTAMTEFGDWLAGLNTEVVELVAGRYYYSPTISGAQVASAAFPEGWASVVRVLGDEDCTAHVLDLPRPVRDVAVAAGLQKFNVLSCQLNAVESVMGDVPGLGRGRSPMQVQKWFHHLVERVTMLRADMATVVRLLGTLVQGYCRLEEVPAAQLEKERAMMANHIIESLRALPTPIEGSSASAVEAARTQLAVPAVMSAPDFPRLQPAASDRKYVEMHTRGRAARPKVTMLEWTAGVQYMPPKHRASVQRAIADRGHSGT